MKNVICIKSVICIDKSKLVYCSFKYCICIFVLIFQANHATTGYPSQHIWRLSQARIKWEGCSRKGIRCKNVGDDGNGSLISPDGVTPIRMVSVSASVIFRCTLKVQKKISSGTASPRWSRKKGRKMVMCVRACVSIYHANVTDFAALHCPG